MPRLSLPGLLLVCCSLSLFATAVEFNFTLDHTHPHISYFPPSSWSTRSHCNRTWHEPVYLGAGSSEDANPVSISVDFSGIALYLYSPPDHSPTFSRLSYNLDGHSVSSLSPCSPNSPFFAYWNLQNAPHKLIVTVDPTSPFSFDYLIYTTASEPTPPLLVQARQATDENTPLSTTTDTSSTSTSAPSNSGPSQIGAIAYAIAASVGITSLFSIGLAISVIKIRRQRNRVRRESRERREEDRNRSRGLTIHLPPPSTAGALQRPRHTPDTPTSANPPSYNTVMGPVRNSTTAPAQSSYPIHSHLATISEVATVFSLSRPSVSSRRDTSIVREDSLEGMPPSPPGLEEQTPLPTIENLVEQQNQSSTSQHPTMRSDHDA